MWQRILNKIAALSMIAILLVWNVFPVFAYAGEFMKPGKAITPGKSFAPGQAIQGGQFIAPGEVYEPGEAYDPGKAAVSGQPILPKSPLNNGVFIIPNATAPLPGSILWQLNGMEQGNALQGGAPVNGGNGVSNGKGPNGGQVMDTGKGPNGGQAADAGKGLNGGQAADAGEGPNGGKAADTGDGTDGGKATESGKATDAGDAPDGGEAEEEKTPSLLNTLVKTTDGERGWFSHVTGIFDDFKTYGLGFLNRDVAGAALSMMAGFKIEKIAGTTDGYKVTGQKNSKLFDSLYQRYKGYDVNGSDRSLGTHTKRIKESTFNQFLQSKELRPKGMKLSTFVANSIKSGVIDGWSPFTKKIFTSPIKSFKDRSLFNKAFISKSNMIKMNGPLNYAMAAAGTLWDYSPEGNNSKKGYFSSDFFTDLSTEVAIGVGSTAIGSIASSVATGMVAGSVVPGLGTVAGAAAGLLAGLGTAVFINRTSLGKGIKNGIKSGFKFVYSNIGKGLGKVGGLIGIGK
ncbi:hypothetical protein [Niallia oryzisoli]|uniref:hypothetical protein n=1 Tax=Niallia oryzisoli TaxID=1737571 RepID=UPI00373682AD